MEIRCASEEHMPVVVALTLQELADLERLGEVRKEAIARAINSLTYEMNRDK
jgi:hypothetical protein